MVVKQSASCSDSVRIVSAQIPILLTSLFSCCLCSQRLDLSRNSDLVLSLLMKAEGKTGLVLFL